MNLTESQPLIDLVVDFPHVTPTAARRGEPVTCGVPLPKGLVRDPIATLLSANGDVVPSQITILDRWADGTARWMLVDWAAHGVSGDLSHYRLTPGKASGEPTRGLQIRQEGRTVTIGSGVAEFVVAPGEQFPFQRVADTNGRSAIDPSRSMLRCQDDSGASHRTHIESVTIERQGPLRATLKCSGIVGTDRLLDLVCWLHFYAGLPVVSFELMLRNPRRAAHPDNIWTLGDSGSVLLKDVSLVLAWAADETWRASLSAESHLPHRAVTLPFELYQDSSGGERWNGSIHRNRNGEVPLAFRGYRLRANGQETFGLRATPIARWTGPGAERAIAVPEFWQNFPKALSADIDGSTLSLFPAQSLDVHELQGGEQKTHCFSVAFDTDPIASDPLEWVRAPALARCTPEWYATSGVVPYITPLSCETSATYVSLCYAAIDGSDTFESKRETIDEYGWRNFGDLYGDHEAIHQPGRLVSHYNNQYDVIAGFAYQFMRSGDGRWWRQLLQLTRHVVDIDIYHTTQDKAAYNHGLFWHTVHYIDAGTSTHRSYPRAKGVHGGGPASDHNYTTGLKLHHFMTGATWSREAAIDLGNYVIDRDDPKATPLWWIDRGYTGLASVSQAAYHGPGRASGNSVNALVDAYELTGERRYLDKAEQLIRRCMHPSENIDRHELLDAERRWFYTMMLQAVGRYLDIKAERGQYDYMYGYAQASLLHYARWMAVHERPYLDHPEQLEFPTESWAAMDMRKSDVFKFAARHSRANERETFLERSEFFFKTSTETLAQMPTRTLTRPVVMMLTHGFMHAWFRQPIGSIDAKVAAPADYGSQEPFVPQMVRARKRLMLGLALGGFAAVAAVGLWLLRSS